jgi:hypothetical protein
MAGVSKTILMRLVVGLVGCAAIAALFPFMPEPSLRCDNGQTPDLCASAVSAAVANTLHIFLQRCACERVCTAVQYARQYSQCCDSCATQFSQHTVQKQQHWPAIRRCGAFINTFISLVVRIRCELRRHLGVLTQVLLKVY